MLIDWLYIRLDIIQLGINILAETSEGISWNASQRHKAIKISEMLWLKENK